MAISPEQLLNTFKEDVERFEKIIDQKLITSNLSLQNYVTMEIPKGMNYKHFEILRVKYLQVGWKEIKWNSDQREGDWLEFTTK